MKNIKNVMWGLLFILLGVIIALNSFGITDIDIFFDGWWTLFIIVPNFISLFNDKDKTGNIIWLIVGISLFLVCRDLLDIEFILKLIFPIILIVIGLSII